MGANESKSLTTTGAGVNPNVFSMNQMIRNVEKTFGNEIATIDVDGNVRNYSLFCDRVKKLGTALKQECGFGKGQKAAILSLNCPEYLESLFGVPWSGGWCVPLNIRLAVAEQVAVLKDCEANVLFVDGAFKPMVAALIAQAQSIKTVIYIGKDDPPPGAKVYEKLLESIEAPMEAEDVAGDDVMLLAFTGGTTGKSKGVMLTHTNLMVNAYCMIAQLHYDTSSRYLHSAPMFHLADASSTFALTMVGAKHYFIPKFDPTKQLETIQKHEITHALMVPTMFQMVMALPNLDEFNCSTLRYALYGASPMPVTLLEQSMKFFANANFVQGYGQTEASPIITFLGPEEHRKGGDLLFSAGRPAPHVEVRIVDENDNEVPPGEVGELICRGPHVMKGYYKMPETTASTMRNGWLHTGDGASRDEMGYIYIRDRIKDMIVTGGENVYSVEVENCIKKIPEVEMCAVIGIPDDKLVEMVAAIVQVKEENLDKLTPESVIKHCHEYIAGYKCPREVVIRTAPLPLSGAGKILKTKLREPFWDPKSHIYSKDENRKTEYDSKGGK